MIPDDWLGRQLTLPVLRLLPRGALVGDDDRTSVMLPWSEVPDGTREGDELSVFVHLDSEDQPIATRREPRLRRDEVTFLQVADVTSMGAFLDWGLPKQLFLPPAETTRDVLVGERHPVGLVLDRTGRLSATMRVRELLRSAGSFREDEWVTGEAWRNEPEVGLFVILERAYIGLVPWREPHTLRRGEATQFRVAAVLPDGKLELSLRRPAHQEIEGDADRIRATLARQPTLRLGDHSDPDAIRAAFGLSKKAFKRAAGRLLREGAAELDASGCLRLRP